MKKIRVDLANKKITTDERLYLKDFIKDLNDLSLGREDIMISFYNYIGTNVFDIELYYFRDETEEECILNQIGEYERKIEELKSKIK